MYILLALHKEPYGNLPVAAADPAPEKVQAAGTAGSRMTGPILFIMVILLAAMAFTLLKIEISLERQLAALQDSQSDMVNKLNSMEKALRHKRALPRNTAVSEGTCKGNALQGSCSGTPASGKGGTLEGPPGGEAKGQAGFPLPSLPSPRFPAGEPPRPVCGLYVAKSAHFNPSGIVNLREMPQEDALFLLYPDMTVCPAPGQFRIFNNGAYYINNNFDKIFDFQDQNGRDLNLSRAMQCLKTAENALVCKNGSEYTLSRKGILIAEERFL